MHHALRHWKATNLFHKTQNIIQVMQMLGHKNINNTMIYMHLDGACASDEFHSAVASMVEECQTHIEAGFEYVCDVSDVKLFRKRK